MYIDIEPPLYAHCELWHEKYDNRNKNFKNIHVFCSAFSSKLVGSQYVLLYEILVKYPSM